MTQEKKNGMWEKSFWVAISALVGLLCFMMRDVYSQVQVQRECISTLKTEQAVSGVQYRNIQDSLTKIETMISEHMKESKTEKTRGRKP